MKTRLRRVVFGLWLAVNTVFVFAGSMSVIGVLLLRFGFFDSEFNGESLSGAITRVTFGVTAITASVTSAYFHVRPFSSREFGKAKT